MDPGGALIRFDGGCVLCRGWVRFLLARDRAGRLRFAPLEAPGDTVVVETAAGTFRRSDAVLEVLKRLPAPWRWAGLLRALPRPWRDAVYDAVARNRHRWFGRDESCPVLPPEGRDRFTGGPRG
ncbi:thiol-disulfide oxidoreductase DCC family protein [Mesoterricola sediminis]|uniref:Membrane protein n=1 Tax=Mesoterricola sediminis TaxID=2927980 RepID=A0AA48KHF4_9BACT|nr:DCC1-like thiol-disulfide oxidoreductase family protein [Mesoterricola sediminis]BDU78323.1 membrane protein [Mesoterricola sediminis]